jgi:hypothetical protein
MRNKAVWRHWPLIAISAAFLALGIYYSIANPLFESPDEVWHYEYVRWLVEDHGLPQPEQVGHAAWNQEGSQPPLYYLAAALLTKPIPTGNADAVIRYNPHAAMGQGGSFGNKNVIVHGQADAWPWQGVALAAHLLRLFSLLLGAVTVACTYGTALAVFGDRREFAASAAATAAALVAFNPEFLFLSAAVNNDNLVIACSAAAIWICVVLIGRSWPAPAERSGLPWPLLVALGALVGAAALSKLSGLALAAPVALTIALLAWRRRSVKDFVLAGLVAAAAAAAIGGWWYVRNWLLYGDPTGLPAMFDVLPRRATAPGIAELLSRGQGVWRSVWAVFGWFNVLTDDWLVSVYTWLCLIGAAGLLILAPARWVYSRYRPRRLDAPQAVGPGQRADRTRLLQMGLLLVWVLIIFAALLAWAQMRYPQGRLLFPALSAAAVLLSYGLHQWLAGIRLAWPRGLRFTPAGLASAVLASGLLVLAAIVPGAWIVPAYAPPQGAVSAANSTGQTVNADAPLAEFNGQIELYGYQLESLDALPGEDVYITLTWQARRPTAADYSVFLHLVDENGIIQAQNDSYPGAGALPTSRWTPGALVSDRHAIHIPDTALAPARLVLEVGLYTYADGVRLPVTGRASTEVLLPSVRSDALALTYVNLGAPSIAGDLPNSLRIDFDGQIALRGFALDQQEVTPGGKLGVSFWWEAERALPRDYVLFAHVLLPPDAVWAQIDEMPAGPALPTSHWQAGQLVSYRHEIPLPATMPAGVYTLEIGLYDPATMDRLPVNFSDKGIVLAQVKVSAPPR